MLYPTEQEDSVVGDFSDPYSNLYCNGKGIFCQSSEITANVPR